MHAVSIRIVAVPDIQLISTLFSTQTENKFKADCLG